MLALALATLIACSTNPGDPKDSATDTAVEVGGGEAEDHSTSQLQILHASQTIGRVEWWVNGHEVGPLGYLDRTDARPLQVGEVNMSVWVDIDHNRKWHAFDDVVDLPPGPATMVVWGGGSEGGREGTLGVLVLDEEDSPHGLDLVVAAGAGIWSVTTPQGEILHSDLANGAHTFIEAGGAPVVVVNDTEIDVPQDARGIVAVVGEGFITLR